MDTIAPTVELSTPERHRLLAQLANFMDDLPHDRFHMPSWGSQNATETHCGTAGCAGGWAVSLFHRYGLKFVDFGIKYHEKPVLIISYKDKRYSDAFAVFFNISPCYAQYITSYLSPEDSYLSIPGLNKDLKTYCEEHDLVSAKDITPRHVAKRIREVLQEIALEALEETAKPVVPEPVCV